MMASAPTATITELEDITVSLPTDVLREIDALAAEKGRTRSEVLTSGARRYLFDEERWRALQTSAAEHARRAGLHTEEEMEDYLDSLDDDAS